MFYMKGGKETLKVFYFNIDEKLRSPGIKGTKFQTS